MVKNNARLPDINTLLQAGIDPNTGLPIKCGSKFDLKDRIKTTLRVIDEQDAIRRYAWYNLPNGLNGELLERVLYYRGQGMFFHMDSDDKFYFLPYALDGTIDCYGRFMGVTPLPFNGTANNSKEVWIQGLVKNPVYDIEDILVDSKKYFENGCVLLHDYANQISQTNIPRQTLQDPILDAMAEAFPMARTSLLANSGIKAMRVQDQDSESNVKAASRTITRAALEGDPFIAIQGQLDFQDLTSSGSALKSEEYLLYMQSLDNYRLGLYGLDNGGIFEKKSHILQSEQDMNAGRAKAPYNDGLLLRQSFCDMVNAIWGLGIWCDVSESALGVDHNQDGEAVDELDQNGISGDQPDMINGGDLDE